MHKEDIVELAKKYDLEDEFTEMLDTDVGLKNIANAFSCPTEDLMEMVAYLFSIAYHPSNKYYRENIDLSKTSFMDGPKVH